MLFRQSLGSLLCRICSFGISLADCRSFNLADRGARRDSIAALSALAAPTLSSTSSLASRNPARSLASLSPASASAARLASASLARNASRPRTRSAATSSPAALTLTAPPLSPLSSFLSGEDPAAATPRPTGGAVVLSSDEAGWRELDEKVNEYPDTRVFKGIGTAGGGDRALFEADMVRAV